MKDSTREIIVSTARTWGGTPYHHQARLKGHGVDCAQLVIGVGLELGYIDHYPAEYMRYGRVARPDYMRARLTEFMDQIPESKAGPGDIIWMGWRKTAPIHLGIITNLHGDGIIHAYAQDGKVVETALPKEFRLMADSYWRYRTGE